MAEVLEKQYTAKKIAARQDELLVMARRAVDASPADQTQVNLTVVDNALTRFANSQIHQNNFEREAFTAVLARVGQREGRVLTNRLTAEGLIEAVERATAAAKVSEPNPDLADLPEGPREYPFQVDYYEVTAACTPEERAKLAIKGFAVSDDPSFTAAGTLGTTQINRVIVNNRGIEVAYNTTHAKYTVLYTGADSSGYAEQESRNVAAIDIEKAASTALATAKRSANPYRDLPIGRYTVILSPDCLSTMVHFLVWLGLSGRDYNDGASFMCGRIGEPISGSALDLADDPLEPRTLALPCDAAGVPKQRMILVESGVARAVVHDANSAKKAGTATTGHDTGSGFPAPVNLVLSPGASSRDELVRGVRQGVLVSRFHYTNVVDPLNTVITGMTRDGTFLIENGELTRGLTNFRFTQNILDAFRECSGAATEQIFAGAFWGGGCLVPEAMRVEEFNFSGKTEH